MLNGATLLQLNHDSWPRAPGRRAALVCVVRVIVDTDTGLLPFSPLIYDTSLNIDTGTAHGDDVNMHVCPDAPWI